VNTSECDSASVIDEGFLGVGEAARFLQISRSKVYALMDKGDLLYAKFGRCRRIPKKALAEFAERSLVHA
jgi:excisionase family DNA binding protein